MNKEMMLMLRKKYGEAFYVLDIERFENNFKELKTAFKSIYTNFNIAYSFKTNYIPKICESVMKQGGYAEIVSEMELQLAEKIGFDYSRIIWNGPIKEMGILQEYILKGGTVNIDSYEEFTVLKSIAEKVNNKVINLGIRCNFDIGDGTISRFGIDVESKEFAKMICEILDNTNMKISSLQCHFANRQIDYWEKRTQKIISLLKEYQLKPDRIDLGGGLYGKMKDELKSQFKCKIPNYSEYANCIAPLFRAYCESVNIKPELIIEPGTALVGDCMEFVGTVKAIKTVRGKCFITILGSQKNINMTGINPPIEIFNINDEQVEVNDADIVGYTCIEGDLLYKGYKGSIGIGDMIAFSNCGSYSVVMKPPFILPNFPIVSISSDNKDTLIKRKESFNDIFYTYTFS